MVNREDHETPPEKRGISNSFLCVARAFHANTHAHLCDPTTGKTASRLRSQQGVRQGSVEGPACFIMVCDEGSRT